MHEKPATRLIALILFLAVFIPAGPALAGTEGVGTLKKAVGQLRAYSPDQGRRFLKKGDPVFKQDVISSGANVKGEIVFKDGSILQIGPESEVRIEDFAYDAENAENSSQALKMLIGVFRFVTGKVTAQSPDNLKVSTPLATIGIRGTTTDHLVKPDKELHALRESASNKSVRVVYQEKTLILPGPDTAAEVGPKAASAPTPRPLTDVEKEFFADTPIDRAPFDPKPGRKFRGGGA